MRLGFRSWCRPPRLSPLAWRTSRLQYPTITHHRSPQATHLFMFVCQSDPNSFILIHLADDLISQLLQVKNNTTEEQVWLLFDRWVWLGWLRNTHRQRSQTVVNELREAPHIQSKCIQKLFRAHILLCCIFVLNNCLNKFIVYINSISYNDIANNFV